MINPFAKDTSFVVKPIKDETPVATACTCQDHKSTIEMVDETLSQRIEAVAIGGIKIYAAIKLINTASTIAVHFATKL